VAIGVLAWTAAVMSPASAAPPQRDDARETAKPFALPSQVDLLPLFRKYQLEPRGQGRRNTCSVFTATEAIEFALSRSADRGVRLSVEYLNWACNQVIGNKTDDRGQFFHDLLKGYQRYGVCPEKDMPYQTRFDPELKPSPAAREKARAALQARLLIHWINPWKKDPGLTNEQLREIKEVIARRWPVAAGSSHSRLLVGYVDDPRQPGGGLFRTIDSGRAGIDAVSYDFVKTKVGDVFWVEAPGVETLKKP
jgi:hypothetical protein